MGKNVDIRQLREFQKKLERMQKDNNEFLEACAKELAARLLAKVIKRTPVGDYSNEVEFTTSDGKKVQFTTKQGKVGGTLRRGWTGGKRASTKGYVESLKVNHFGDTYVIEIINPVEYASYVEFGHRTANHKGWVEGRFMLTISEQEIQRDAPRILEKKIEKKLREGLK